MSPLKSLPAAALAFAALLLPVPGHGAARALPGDTPEKLKSYVVDGAFSVETRLKAAVDLAREGPELLGNALVELGEKAKDPANLDFLVKYVCSEEVRHFRVLGTWAAWQSSPDGALGAFLKATESEDDKQAARAVDAAGLVAPLGKDRAVYAQFLAIARGPRAIPGIEAARACNRLMDRRLTRDLVAAAIEAVDNHVRKHLVWAVVDLEGERGALKTFQAQKGRPGDAGKNADECANVVLDKQSEEFTWKPQALRDAPTWWKKGRPAGGALQVTIGDKATQEKVAGWITELVKEAPAWGNLANSTLHRISLRTNKEPEIFDLKAKTLLIDAAEIARVESDWQGSYVVSRDACIAMCAIMGEPSAGHRGWEPAYVDIHSFYKTTKRNAGKLEEFVDKAVAGRPWP